MSAEKGQLAILNKLWDWAKEVLTGEELNNTSFLAKDGDEKTTWHMASQKGQIEVIQKLWEWATHKEWANI